MDSLVMGQDNGVGRVSQPRLVRGVFLLGGTVRPLVKLADKPDDPLAVLARLRLELFQGTPRAGIDGK